jgi:hypothetical protein
MAHYHILNEVRTGESGHWQLCFQYGVYEYDPAAGAQPKLEFGYRFIYRRPNGQLQGARGQARLEPEWITVLLGKAAGEGWYPVPPHTRGRNFRIGDTLWRVSIQTPVVVRAAASGDYVPIPEQGGLRFVSETAHYFLPLDYPELPSAEDLALLSRDQLHHLLQRVRGDVASKQQELGSSLTSA